MALLIVPLELVTLITNESTIKAEQKNLQRAWQQLLNKEFTLLSHLSDARSLTIDSMPSQFVQATESEIAEIKNAQHTGQKYLFTQRDEVVIMWSSAHYHQSPLPTCGLKIDTGKLQEYSRILQVELSLSTKTLKPTATANSKVVQILYDSNKNVVGTISNNSSFNPLINTNNPYIRVTFFIISMSFLASIGMLYVWMIHPVQKILDAIESGRPTRLNKIKNASREIKRLARLVQDFYLQKENLVKEIQLKSDAENSLKSF